MKPDGVKGFGYAVVTPPPISEVVQKQLDAAAQTDSALAQARRGGALAQQYKSIAYGSATHELRLAANISPTELRTTLESLQERFKDDSGGSRIISAEAEAVAAETTTARAAWLSDFERRTGQPGQMAQTNSLPHFPEPIVPNEQQARDDAQADISTGMQGYQAPAPALMVDDPAFARLLHEAGQEMAAARAALTQVNSDLKATQALGGSVAPGSGDAVKLDGQVKRQQDAVNGAQARLDAANARIAAVQMLAYSDQAERDYQTAQNSGQAASQSYEVLAAALPQDIQPLKQGAILSPAQIARLDPAQQDRYNRYLDTQSIANRDAARYNAVAAHANQSMAQLQVYASDPRQYGKAAANAIADVNKILAPRGLRMQAPKPIDPGVASRALTEAIHGAQGMLIADAALDAADGLLRYRQLTAPLAQAQAGVEQAKAAYYQWRYAAPHLQPGGTSYERDLATAQDVLRQAQAAAGPVNAQGTPLHIEQAGIELNVRLGYYRMLQDQQGVKDAQGKLDSLGIQLQNTGGDAAAAGRLAEQINTAQSDLALARQRVDVSTLGFTATYAQAYAKQRDDTLDQANQALKIQGPYTREVLDRRRQTQAKAQAEAKGAHEVADQLAKDAEKADLDFKIAFNQNQVSVLQKQLVQAQTAFDGWRNANPHLNAPGNRLEMVLTDAGRALQAAQDSLAGALNQQIIERKNALMDEFQATLPEHLKHVDFSKTNRDGSPTKDQQAYLKAQSDFFNAHQDVLVRGMMAEEKSQFNNNQLMTWGPPGGDESNRTAPYANGRITSEGQFRNIIGSIAAPGSARPVLYPDGSRNEQADWFAGNADVNKVIDVVRQAAVDHDHPEFAVEEKIYGEDMQVIRMIRVKGNGKDIYVGKNGAQYDNWEDFAARSELSADGKLYSLDDAGNIRSEDAHHDTFWHSFVETLKSDTFQFVAGIALDLAAIPVAATGFLAPIAAVMELDGSYMIADALMNGAQSAATHLGQRIEREGISALNPLDMDGIDALLHGKLANPLNMEAVGDYLGLGGAGLSAVGSIAGKAVGLFTAPTVAAKIMSPSAGVGTKLFTLGGKTAATLGTVAKWSGRIGMGAFAGQIAQAIGQGIAAGIDNHWDKVQQLAQEQVVSVAMLGHGPAKSVVARTTYTTKADINSAAGSKKIRVWNNKPAQRVGNPDPFFDGLTITTKEGALNLVAIDGGLVRVNRNGTLDWNGLTLHIGGEPVRLDAFTPGRKKTMWFNGREVSLERRGTTLALDGKPVTVSESGELLVEGVPLYDAMTVGHSVVDAETADAASTGRSTALVRSERSAALAAVRNAALPPPVPYLNSVQSAPAAPMLSAQGSIGQPGQSQDPRGGNDTLNPLQPADERQAAVAIDGTVVQSLGNMPGEVSEARHAEDGKQAAHLTVQGRAAPRRLVDGEAPQLVRTSTEEKTESGSVENVDTPDAEHARMQALRRAEHERTVHEEQDAQPKWQSLRSERYRPGSKMESGRRISINSTAVREANRDVYTIERHDVSGQIQTHFVTVGETRSGTLTFHHTNAHGVTLGIPRHPTLLKLFGHLPHHELARKLVAGKTGVAHVIAKNGIDITEPAYRRLAEQGMLQMAIPARSASRGQHDRPAYAEPPASKPDSELDELPASAGQSSLAGHETIETRLSDPDEAARASGRGKPGRNTPAPGSDTGTTVEYVPKDPHSRTDAQKTGIGAGADAAEAGIAQGNAGRSIGSSRSGQGEAQEAGRPAVDAKEGETGPMPQEETGEERSGLQREIEPEPAWLEEKAAEQANVPVHDTDAAVHEMPGQTADESGALEEIALPVDADANPSSVDEAHTVYWVKSTNGVRAYFGTDKLRAELHANTIGGIVIEESAGQADTHVSIADRTKDVEEKASVDADTSGNGSRQPAPEQEKPEPEDERSDAVPGRPRAASPVDEAIPGIGAAETIGRTDAVQEDMQTGAPQPDTLYAVVSLEAWERLQQGLEVSMPETGSRDDMQLAAWMDGSLLVQFKQDVSADLRAGIDQGMPDLGDLAEVTDVRGHVLYAAPPPLMPQAMRPYRIQVPGGEDYEVLFAPDAVERLNEEGSRFDATRVSLIDVIGRRTSLIGHERFFAETGRKLPPGRIYTADDRLIEPDGLLFGIDASSRALRTLAVSAEYIAAFAEPSTDSGNEQPVAKEAAFNFGGGRAAGSRDFHRDTGAIDPDRHRRGFPVGHTLRAQTADYIDSLIAELEQAGRAHANHVEQAIGSVRDEKEWGIDPDNHLDVMLQSIWLMKHVLTEARRRKRRIGATERIEGRAKTHPDFQRHVPYDDMPDPRRHGRRYPSGTRGWEGRRAAPDPDPREALDAELLRILKIQKNDMALRYGHDMAGRRVPASDDWIRNALIKDGKQALERLRVVHGAAYHEGKVFFDRIETSLETWDEAAQRIQDEAARYLAAGQRLADILAADRLSPHDVGAYVAVLKKIGAKEGALYVNDADVHALIAWHDLVIEGDHPEAMKADVTLHGKGGELIAGTHHSFAVIGLRIDSLPYQTEEFFQNGSGEFSIPDWGNKLVAVDRYLSGTGSGLVRPLNQIINSYRQYQFYRKSINDEEVTLRVVFRGTFILPGNPYIHPRQTAQGGLVRIDAPTGESGDQTWESAGVATFTPVSRMPSSLGGIKVARRFSGQISALVDIEPVEMPAANKALSVEVMMIEADGSVWVAEPTNGRQSRRYMLPHAEVEEGATLHDAALQAMRGWTGFDGVPIGVINDYVTGKSVTRLIAARRIGGTPADMREISQAVNRIPLNQLPRFLEGHGNARRIADFSAWFSRHGDGSSLVLADALRRRMTVQDCLEARYVTQPLIHSPDGKCCVLVVRWDDIKSNTRRFALVVVDSDAPVEGRPAARTICELDSTAENDGLRECRWLDDRRIAFLGEKAADDAQVYAVDIDTGAIEQLTEHDTAVVNYAIAGDGTIVYVAHQPRDLEKRQRMQESGFVVEPGKNYFENLATEWDRDGHPFEQLLDTYAARGGRLEPVQLGDSHRWANTPAYRFSYGDDFLSASPYGRYVLMSRSGENFEQFYYLIDLAHDTIRPLLPRGDDFAPNSSETFAWSPDGRSLALRAVLEDGAPGQEESTGMHYVVEVDLADGTTTKVAASPRNGNTSTVHYTSIVTWRHDGLVLRASRRNRVPGIGPFGDSEGPLTRYIKRDDAWLPLPGEALVERRPIRLEQAHDSPPRVVMERTDEAGQTAVLLDPNPQFDMLQLASTEIIHWTSSCALSDTESISDETWEGLLYYPPGFDSGKKYPLVIQTHGYDATSFEPTGYPNGGGPFAAQALAAKGMLVLQIGAGKRGYEVMGQPGEGRYMDAGVREAIRHLRERGIVNLDRIGLIGWSRTALHALGHLGLQWDKTREDLNFAAVVAAAGINLSFAEHGTANPGYRRGIEHTLGAAPYGNSEDPMENLQQFIKFMKTTWEWHIATGSLSTPLSLEKYNTDITNSYYSMLLAALDRKFPVEFRVFPGASHGLHLPRHREGSVQGNVDWFAYWLLDERPMDPDTVARYDGLRRMRDQIREQAQRSQEIAQPTLEIKVAEPASQTDAAGETYRSRIGDPEDPQYHRRVDDGNEPRRGRGWRKWRRRTGDIGRATSTPTGAPARQPQTEDGHLKDLLIASLESSLLFDGWKYVGRDVLHIFFEVDNGPGNAAMHIAIRIGLRLDGVKYNRSMGLADNAPLPESMMEAWRADAELFNAHQLSLIERFGARDMLVQRRELLLDFPVPQAWVDEAVAGYRPDHLDRSGKLLRLPVFITTHRYPQFRQEIGSGPEADHENGGTGDAYQKAVSAIRDQSTGIFRDHGDFSDGSVIEVRLPEGSPHATETALPDRVLPTTAEEIPDAGGTVPIPSPEDAAVSKTAVVEIIPMLRSFASPGLNVKMDEINAEISSGTLSLETAETLALNQAFLHLPETAWRRVRQTLDSHYRQQGMEAVEAPGHPIGADFAAAKACVNFGISVEDAVAEYRARDWSRLVGEITQEVGVPVHFSDFIHLCRCVVIVPKLQALRGVAIERERASRIIRNSAVRADARRDYEQRLHALREIDVNFRLPGLPRGCDLIPREILAELFGRTDTSRAFTRNTAYEAIPEKMMPLLYPPLLQDAALPLEDLAILQMRHIYDPDFMSVADSSKELPGAEVSHSTPRYYAGTIEAGPDAPRFFVGRAGYADVQGMEFVADVGTWGDKRILDPVAGGAEFFEAILDPGTDNRGLALPASPPAELVAAGADQPEQIGQSKALADAREAGIFRHFDGRFGEEDFPLERQFAAYFDRIVAVREPIHDRDFFCAISSYGLMLKEGGILHFNLLLNNMLFVDEHGIQMSVEDVFGLMRGVELTPGSGSWKFRNVTAFSARRTAESMSIPATEREILETGVVPVIRYRVRRVTSELEPEAANILPPVSAVRDAIAPHWQTVAEELKAEPGVFRYITYGRPVMTRVEIRLASPDDATALSKLISGAERWINQQSGRTMWTIGEYFTPERLTANIAEDGHCFFLASVDGEPAGMFWYTLDDRDFWPEFSPDDAGYVHRLAIDRKYAGQGVAATILEFAARLTRRLGRHHSRLDCMLIFPELLELYRSYGYKRDSEFTEFVNEETNRMQLMLRPAMSVEDYLAITHVSTPPLRSPDGTRYATVLGRHHPGSGTREFDLMVIDLTPSAGSVPQSRMVYRIGTTAAADGLFNARWLGNTHIALAARPSDTEMQVQVVNVETGEIQRVADDADPVAGFDISEDGTVFYVPSAWRDEHEHPSDATFAEDDHTGLTWAQEMYLGAAEVEKWTAENTVLGRFMNERMLTTCERNGVREYHVLDLGWPRIRIGQLLAMPVDYVQKVLEFAWSPDGASIAVKTILPLKATDASGNRGRLVREEAVVEIVLESGAIAGIIAAPPRARNLPAGAKMRWREGGIVFALPTTGGAAEAGPVRFVKRRDGSWLEVEASGASTEVRLVKDMDETQRLVASSGDARGPGTTVLLPNPQLPLLQNIKTEVITWKSASFEWRGRLHLPPDFDLGQRYPVIIHMDDTGIDMLDPANYQAGRGDYSAQALATQGMVVLQIEEAELPPSHPCRKQLSRRSQPYAARHLPKTKLGDCLDASEGIESALEHLASRGLADMNKTGILGMGPKAFQVLFHLQRRGHPFAAAMVVAAGDELAQRFLELRYSIEPDFYIPSEADDIWNMSEPWWDIRRLSIPLHVASDAGGAALERLQSDLAAGLEISPSIKEGFIGQIGWFDFWLQQTASIDLNDPERMRHRQEMRDRLADGKLALLRDGMETLERLVAAHGISHLGIRGEGQWFDVVVHDRLMRTGALEKHVQKARDSVMSHLPPEDMPSGFLTNDAIDPQAVENYLGFIESSAKSEAYAFPLQGDAYLRFYADAETQAIVAWRDLVTTGRHPEALIVRLELHDSAGVESPAFSHAFVVIGIDPRAPPPRYMETGTDGDDIARVLASFGSDAVIVDWWRNSVKPARVALDDYLRRIRADESDGGILRIRLHGAISLGEGIEDAMVASSITSGDGTPFSVLEELTENPLFRGLTTLSGYIEKTISPYTGQIEWQEATEPDAELYRAMDQGRTRDALLAIKNESRAFMPLLWGLRVYSHEEGLFPREINTMRALAEMTASLSPEVQAPLVLCDIHAQHNHIPPEIYEPYYEAVAQEAANLGIPTVMLSDIYAELGVQLADIEERGKALVQKAGNDGDADVMVTLPGDYWARLKLQAKHTVARFPGVFTVPAARKQTAKFYARKAEIYAQFRAGEGLHVLNRLGELKRVNGAPVLVAHIADPNSGLAGVTGLYINAIDDAGRITAAIPWGGAVESSRSAPPRANMTAHDAEKLPPQRPLGTLDKEEGSGMDVDLAAADNRFIPRIFTEALLGSTAAGADTMQYAAVQPELTKDGVRRFRRQISDALGGLRRAALLRGTRQAKLSDIRLLPEAALREFARTSDDETTPYAATRFLPNGKRIIAVRNDLAEHVGPDMQLEVLRHDAGHALTHEDARTVLEKNGLNESAASLLGFWLSRCAALDTDAFTISRGAYTREFTERLRKARAGQHTAEVRESDVGLLHPVDTLLMEKAVERIGWNTSMRALLDGDRKAVAALVDAAERVKSEFLRMSDTEVLAIAGPELPGLMPAISSPEVSDAMERVRDSLALENARRLDLEGQRRRWLEQVEQLKKMALSRIPGMNSRVAVLLAVYDQQMVELGRRITESAKKSLGIATEIVALQMRNTEMPESKFRHLVHIQQPFALDASSVPTGQIRVADGSATVPGGLLFNIDASSGALCTFVVPAAYIEAFAGAPLSYGETLPERSAGTVKKAPAYLGGRKAGRGRDVDRDTGAVDPDDLQPGFAVGHTLRDAEPSEPPPEPPDMAAGDEFDEPREQSTSNVLDTEPRITNVIDAELVRYEEADDDSGTRSFIIEPSDMPADLPASVRNRLFASGSLTSDGELSFYIYTRVPLSSNEEIRVQSLSGKAALDEILNHFGDDVKSVRKTFVDGDNLAQFVQEVDAGASEKEALMKTWAGHELEKRGFKLASEDGEDRLNVSESEERKTVDSVWIKEDIPQDDQEKGNPASDAGPANSPASPPPSEPPPEPKNPDYEPEDPPESAGKKLSDTSKSQGDEGTKDDYQPGSGAAIELPPDEPHLTSSSKDEPNQDSDDNPDTDTGDAQAMIIEFRKLDGTTVTFQVSADQPTEFIDLVAGLMQNRYGAVLPEGARFSDNVYVVGDEEYRAAYTVLKDRDDADVDDIAALLDGFTVFGQKGDAIAIIKKQREPTPWGTAKQAMAFTLAHELAHRLGSGEHALNDIFPGLAEGFADEIGWEGVKSIMPKVNGEQVSLQGFIHHLRTKIRENGIPGFVHEYMAYVGRSAIAADIIAAAGNDLVAAAWFGTDAQIKNTLLTFIRRGRITRLGISDETGKRTFFIPPSMEATTGMQDSSASSEGHTGTVSEPDTSTEIMRELKRLQNLRSDLENDLVITERRRDVFQAIEEQTLQAYTRSILEDNAQVLEAYDAWKRTGNAGSISDEIMGIIYRAELAASANPLCQKAQREFYEAEEQLDELLDETSELDDHIDRYTELARIEAAEISAIEPTQQDDMEQVSEEPTNLVDEPESGDEDDDDSGAGPEEGGTGPRPSDPDVTPHPGGGEVAGPSDVEEARDADTVADIADVPAAPIQDTLGIPEQRQSEPDPQTGNVEEDEAEEVSGTRSATSTDLEPTVPGQVTNTSTTREEDDIDPADGQQDGVGSSVVVPSRRGVAPTDISPAQQRNDALTELRNALSDLEQDLGERITEKNQKIRRKTIDKISKEVQKALDENQSLENLGDLEGLTEHERDFVNAILDDLKAIADLDELKNGDRQNERRDDHAVRVIKRVAHTRKIIENFIWHYLYKAKQINERYNQAGYCEVEQGIALIEARKRESDQLAARIAELEEQKVLQPYGGIGKGIEQLKEQKKVHDLITSDRQRALDGRLVDAIRIMLDTGRSIDEIATKIEKHFNNVFVGNSGSMIASAERFRLIKLFQPELEQWVQIERSVHHLINWINEHPDWLELDSTGRIAVGELQKMALAFGNWINKSTTVSYAQHQSFMEQLSVWSNRWANMIKRLQGKKESLENNLIKKLKDMLGSVIRQSDQVEKSMKGFAAQLAEIHQLHEELAQEIHRKFGSPAQLSQNEIDSRRRGIENKAAKVGAEVGQARQTLEAVHDVFRAAMERLVDSNGAVTVPVASQAFVDGQTPEEMMNHTLMFLNQVKQALQFEEGRDFAHMASIVGKAREQLLIVIGNVSRYVEHI